MSGRPPTSQDPGRTAPGETDADVGESQFLTQQADLARQAISRTLTELKGKLAEGGDPRQWARQYPWATLGASAVAGFVAASMLVPSKEQQALKKLAAIERALNPPPPPKPDPDDIDEKKGQEAYKSGQHSFFKSVMGEVVGAIKPALISLLSSGITASAVKPSQEEMQAAAAAEDHNQAAASGTPPA